MEYRTAEANKIKSKYPDRVPVIVEKVNGSLVDDIDKRKYLVPNDITVAQFMWIIRKRINMPPEKALFLFIDKVVPTSSMTMGEIYVEHKDVDGFLYIQYSRAEIHLSTFHPHPSPPFHLFHLHLGFLKVEIVILVS